MTYLTPYWYRKRVNIMNHIYKIIWSEAKHCYTVVSEIAKSYKNSSNGGSNKKVAALAVALSLVCCYGVVSVEAKITVFVY